MTKKPVRPLSALVLALLFSLPASPTCGGGGGGGMGGMAPAGGGMSMPQQVYYVPWKMAKPQDPGSADGLILYWFPASQNELQKSSLRVSRPLSLYASQC